jgi:hypothetical protein
VIEPVERIARFGPDDHLIGIVTCPARPRSDAPAFLMINAGVVHRIGPHRLHVKIARELAEDGIYSLRMDLSGLGDSVPPVQAVKSGAQAIPDMQAAMAHVEATLGIRRFIVFGLCSGAVNGYRLALADERIVGLLMFDGYVYPTLKTHLRRRHARFRTLSWSALARKPAQWLFRKGSANPAIPTGEESEDSHLVVPTREEFTRTMDMLIARGTSVYLMYSGSFLEGHNYDAQLRDGFRGARFLEHIRYDYVPDIDHTATTLTTQRKLIAAVRDWVQGFGAAGSSGSST